MNSVFALIEKRGEIYCAPGYESLVRAVMCKDLTFEVELFSGILDRRFLQFPWQFSPKFSPP
jgi:hypothetical protein